MDSDAQGGTLKLRGEWNLSGFAALEPALARLNASSQAARIDVSEVERLDSAGALLIARWLIEGKHDGSTAVIGASDEQRALIETTRTALEQPVVHPPRKHWSDLFARVGKGTLDLLEQGKHLLGFIGVTLTVFARTFFQPQRWRTTSVVHHIEQTGLDALPIIALLSFMVGAVITFLGAVVLRDFGASIFAVELVSFSFLREFGVLLTAILLAGRTASAFTAQIGAMKAREEIDAIRTLGLDPVEVLVLPRLIALLIAFPLLTFIAMAAGILGGLVICATSLDISPAMFVARFQDTFDIRHFIVGMLKAPMFASIIALIGCLEGFKVSGSAESVGQRTTSSVVQAIFLVILLDAMFALLFQELNL